MKVALLALFFFLLTFAKADVIFDTDNEELSKGQFYYVTIGSGPERIVFTLQDDWSQSCQLLVTAVPLLSINPPLPVKISHNFSFTYFLTDLPLSFSFRDMLPCDEPTKWFASGSIGSNTWSLMSGNDEGLSVEGDFIVKNYSEDSDAYKIIFCPKKSPKTCRNLTLRGLNYVDIVDGDVDPLEIRFEKPKSVISMVV